MNIITGGDELYPDFLSFAAGSPVAPGSMPAGQPIAATSSDVRMKDDIEKFDSSGFLDSLLSNKAEPPQEGGEFDDSETENRFNSLLMALMEMHKRVKELEGAA